MKSNRQTFLFAPSLILILALRGLAGGRVTPAAPTSPSDESNQLIPFSQNWSNIGLITAEDNWSGVPGIVGYRGDDLTTSTGADPQSILADGTLTPVDIIADSTDPDLTTGGVAEFEITDPVVALQGSGTADAPILLLSLNTTGYTNIQVTYNLRDIDGSADNSVSPVALQYRVGASGNFTNLPAGFVADATTGPSLATLVTLVSATLPSAADNQPQVQVRVITTNAVGSDEWVGVDDLSVTGIPSGGDIAPTVSSTSPTNGGVSFGAGANLTVSFSENVNVTGSWFEVSCSMSSSYPATASGGPQTYTLDPTTDFTLGETCTVTIYAAQVSDQDSVDPPDTMLADYVFNFTVAAAMDPNACGAVHSPIYIIQGSGAASPLDNMVVSTEGVVTGDFQAAGKLDGFFIHATAGDGNPATSDGIFVYAPGGLDVNPGDLVRVMGEVDEFNGLTEIKSIQLLKVCATGQAVASTSLDLPIPVGATLEPYENMLVVLPESLTVSEHYDLGRYGEVVVSADGRLYEPTNDQGGTLELNNRRKLTLDDGSNIQNPATVPYLAADNTLRLGDTVTNLTGVFTYGFSQYRLHPTFVPAFVRANPRPASPQAIGGTLSAASMNVLNYFNGDGLGGGFPTARGASTLQEFERQRAKVIQAILGLNADIVGLMEIEKDGTGPESSIQDLVNGLNAASVPGAYAFITEPAPGTDQIKVAMIYRPAVVEPVGAAQNFQTSTATYSPLFDRPPLAQLFQLNSSGEKLTVVVNHFKSKGSCPASGPDAGQGDGQGCWNAKRTAQAAGLLDFVASLQTADPDVLVIGDLNSYGQEDPVDTLVAGGLVNQVAARVPLAERYTYVFEGQSGYLDHALSTSSLGAQVRGVTIWHINADEPRILDYNTGFNPAYLYNPDSYRSSDHDPVIVGLEPGVVSSGSKEIYLPLIKRP